MPSIVELIGNPKAGSKTRGITDAVVEAMIPLLARPQSVRVSCIELGAIASRLFQWNDPEVQALLEQVAQADLLVVASPTYKATYTGLLKAFLDQFRPEALKGIPAIPLMVGAAPHHALAVEVHLRPVLVELGAICPWRGLYVLESDWDSGHFKPEAWLSQVRPVLAALLHS